MDVRSLCEVRVVFSILFLGSEPRYSQITPLIPLLLSLMTPKVERTLDYCDIAFVAALDTLQELLPNSALSYNTGTKTATEPLLLWLDRWHPSNSFQSMLFPFSCPHLADPKALPLQARLLTKSCTRCACSWWHLVTALRYTLRRTSLT